MLHEIIREKVQHWLQSKRCTINNIITYIRQKGQLRETQIQAIETYLFLKIEGNNKPLWQLFSEGFFIDENAKHLQELNINTHTRNFLENNKNAYALYRFASDKVGKKSRLPHLEELICNHCESVEYERIIKSIFYNVSYADYLLSLPMGAGKTYLMASLIYLDLYFAQNEPENKSFGHNFLVLIPQGLKNSIAPSLKTIADFDPSWVIKEPSATQLKQQLVFEILDEQATSKKSNKARNPNAQKVNQCLPNPFGRVFVLNAEKVILNRLYDNELNFEYNEDEKDLQANELRNLIGKIPHLNILIDEVHHAQKSDIKLRQVINAWSKTENITTVLGFSGTPYLPSAEKIVLSPNDTLKIAEITNTIYYYPLTSAIKSFLKTPQVKIAKNLSPLHIIKQGIEDFKKTYGDKTYSNNTIAKVAIYCSSIEMLEEEVYPYLISDLKISPNEILRFHGGNKKYSLPKENTLEFRQLDTAFSQKKYILLVGIGKEGWDCKSLTSVILPQISKSSSKNSIIQTTCRCLRQVDKNKDETALIWLNQENADILNKQLQIEQHTSIEELNRLQKIKNTMLERTPRIEFLQLPKVDYYELKISYQSIAQEETPNTEQKLQNILSNIEQYHSNISIKTTDLQHLNLGDIKYLKDIGDEPTYYSMWLTDISKDSFNTISREQLHVFDALLQKIFEKITFIKNTQKVFNVEFDRYKINQDIRLAFSIKRTLNTSKETIPKEASLLIMDKLKAIEEHKNLYPNQETCKQILAFDKNPSSIVKEAIKILNQNIAFETLNKDKTFHILPYNFDSSFEKDLLINTLQSHDFKRKHLEIYFNGERGISDFVINCFEKRDKNYYSIGKYTTDFLILQRKENKIHKVLMVETKGSIYANDEKFKKKKAFIETTFLEQNNEKFGYTKFDFLYLQENTNYAKNINDRINQFFD
ncbi:DEAD/DEAH box helicase family protein [Helicobacter cetorum]|uniref:Helicase/UvrB N-terminal domain-containing protein n=1 Tax=Helicobacter cetorum (strain ATCC BAA-540 / CCUG 52418 / MIT 99-5656) TaxID=1163745 RepID=I0ESL9_HELCM|nr:DEAD/DEAH box helicase family protein [Helicobacter cetorum]AFI05938.1 hypothetical protein HCD_04660 [Helicobacter cetorum MIT 99-5656]